MTPLNDLTVLHDTQIESWILSLRKARRLGVRRIQNELFREHNRHLSLATIHKTLTKNQVKLLVINRRSAANTLLLLDQVLEEMLFQFNESQIFSILKEVDAGMKVETICRKHGISNATYYNWKSKYGGMATSELKRMRELEEENAKLKKCLRMSVFKTRQ